MNPLVSVSSVKIRKIRPRRMCYVLPGDPIALARSHFGRDHGYSSLKELRMIMSITLQNQHGELGLFRGPISIRMNFYLDYFQRHNTHYFEGEPHILLPHIYGMIKFVCDISSGILYDDERIVSSVIANKWFSKNPRTEFTVSEVVL